MRLNQRVPAHPLVRPPRRTTTSRRENPSGVSRNSAAPSIRSSMRPFVHQPAWKSQQQMQPPINTGAKRRELVAWDHPARCGAPVSASIKLWHDAGIIDIPRLRNAVEATGNGG